MNRSELPTAAVVGLYLFAAILISSPLIDLLTTAWPPRFTDLSWRYGFLGLGAGYLHTPMIGLVIALATAYVQEHAGVLRLLGVLSLVVAVVLLPVLALWPMDVMQMRDLRTAEVQRGVVIGGVIQELKYLGACVVTGVLGVGSMQAASTARGSRRSPGIVSRD